jgi:hypothetical protein
MEQKDNDTLRTAMAVVRTLEAIRRSHLAELRTGIAIFAIALSILTILITTSRYYILIEVFPFIVALLLLVVVLVVIGSFLIFKSFQGMRHIDEKLKDFQFSLDDFDQLWHEMFNEK